MNALRTGLAVLILISAVPAAAQAAQAVGGQKAKLRLSNIKGNVFTARCDADGGTCFSLGDDQHLYVTQLCRSSGNAVADINISSSALGTLAHLQASEPDCASYDPPLYLPAGSSVSCGGSPGQCLVNGVVSNK